MLSQHDRFAAIKYIGILTVMLLLVTLSGCTPHNIEVTQPVAVNPPGTQHKITAIVTDAEGRPVSHSRVDWILPRSERGVGDIVDTGDDRKTNPGAKKTNTYAKTRTDFDGKATITITSASTRQDVHYRDCQRDSRPGGAQGACGQILDRSQVEISQ